MEGQNIHPSDSTVVLETSPDHALQNVLVQKVARKEGA